MSDSTQLVPTEVLGGALANPDDLNAMLAGGEYLPYFRLYTSNSDPCKEGRIGINHYGMESAGKITDAGTEVEVVVLAIRQKAVQTGDTMVVDYHPKVVEGKVSNPTFAHIMAMSKVKDSGAMYGPELLLWVPSLNSFVTMHLNSATSRREAKAVKIGTFVGKAATLKSKLIDPPGSKYKWQGIVILPCSAQLDLPSVDDMKEQIEKFMDPPVNKVELVGDKSSNRRER